MIKCTIFTTEDELSKLTGLTHELLWEAGFDLDDWDIGFCCEKTLTLNNAIWLLNQMAGYCCGYEEIHYNGNYYYLVYHS